MENKDEEKTKIEYDFDDPATFVEEKFSLKKWFLGLKKIYKIISIAIAAFVIVDIIFCISWLNIRNISSIKLQSLTDFESKKLIALNTAGRTGLIKGSDFANFKFTSEQKKLFNIVYEKNGAVALTVRLCLQPTKNQKEQLSEADNFQFGFITSEDFNQKGKFIETVYPMSKKLVVQGNILNVPDVLDVSFAIKKNDIVNGIIPEGFFIYSSVKCKILAACVVPAQIGFDLTSEVPFFGYAYNGGRVNSTSKSFDFTAGSMIFPTSNSFSQIMPEFTVKLSKDEKWHSKSENSVYSSFSFGGEKIRIKVVKTGSEIVIPAASVKNPFSRIDVLENHGAIESLIMKPVLNESTTEVLNPIRTDPGLILNYKNSFWRTKDYEIFEWDRFSKIIFFDTKDYKIQDNFFLRMAYFVEKEGYKGKLLTDEQLEGKHGYNAHDYSAASMANFFNKAADIGFILNKEEKLLKKILLKNGLFELESDGIHVKANDGGIVSISQESPDYLRTTLLAHEGWHTIFFRDEEFRNFVSAVYYTMDPTSLEFLIEYFKSQPQLGYDVNDDYLMHNEFMAYIMQQRLSEVSKYFVHLANRGSVIKYTPNLAAYVRQNLGAGFEDAAIILNDYVFDTYGIVCGNIALVSR